MKDRVLVHPSVAIPLASAFVCAEDHVWDGRSFDDCPVCCSENRMSLAEVLGTIEKEEVAS